MALRLIGGYSVNGQKKRSLYTVYLHALSTTPLHRTNLFILSDQMSFVRVGRPQQHTKGKRPVRTKKAAAPKKDWVVSTDVKVCPCTLFRHILATQLGG